MNENGDYFPLWGTCLGFELLTYLSANGSEHRASCFSQSQSLPLEFKSDFRSSRLFGAASDEVIDILKSEPVTSNFHQFCVTQKVKENLSPTFFYGYRSCNIYIYFFCVDVNFYRT